MVSGRVEDQGIDLCLADAVGGLGRDAVCAGALRIEAIAPRAKCKTASVPAEARLMPGLAAIGGDLDNVNAIAAVPGDAGDIDRLALLETAAPRRETSSTN